MTSPYAEGRPVENFYLVRERDRRRLRELVILVFGLAPVAIALLGYTWIHLEVRKSGYRIQQLEERLVDLRREERRKNLESAYLSSPQRVEEAAAEQLGMVEVSLDQMIFVDEP